MTRLPASAISVAATRPARPPPTTITSVSSVIRFPVPGAIETRPGGGGQALTCSTLGPFTAKVQPACNTRLEFVLGGPAHLDKIAIRQQAGARVLNQKS